MMDSSLSPVTLKKLSLARFRSLVAAHRDKPLLRAAATACAKFLRAYNNEANWSFVDNGEQYALHTILQRHAGCVFDAGAHVGKWALMAHALDPARPIHAFEISPVTFRHLSDNLVGITTCVLNNVGLSDYEGERDLHYYPESPDRSSLVEQPDGFEKVTQRVRAITGDAYIQSRGIAEIAFLKVDVEGHEMAVLTGFQHSIELGQIAAIQFEHGPAHVLSRHFLGDFVQFLVVRKYELFRIFPAHLEPLLYDYAIAETFGLANYLAVRL